MTPQDSYRIEALSDNFVVIFCTSHLNPISYLPSVENDLKKASFSGEIIFDLLLANGYVSNRFVQARVVDNKIDRGSMKVINSVSSLVLERSREFYKKNRSFVENSSLTDEEQQELLIVN